MKNKFLLLCFLSGGWLLGSLYLAQNHFLISAMLLFFGILAYCLWVKKIIVDRVVSWAVKIDPKSVTMKPGLSGALHALNTSIENIHKKIIVSITAVNSLGKQEEVTELHNVLQDDPLGHALVDASKMIAKIKSEEMQRQWASDGVAMFAKILSNKTEVKEYTSKIISALVKYLDANQGGIFLEMNNEGEGRFMELVACYAYERRKYLEGKVFEGQGLLGQCMLEKDFIFLTDVPSDYVRITSGLGYATPRNIIIAPLIDHDIFYGAIELGTFKVLQPYQVEFLRTICENIASEMAAIRNLDETRQLLNESKSLTAELQSREDELKQNLNQLAATQDEMARKQAEIDGYLSAINITVASAEFNSKGVFIKGNDIFLKVLGYENYELIDRKYDDLMAEEPAVAMMWENLFLGKFFSGEFKMKDKKGNETWLTGTFNPVIGVDGKINKVMMLAQFITQEKEHLNELSEMANILKTSVPLAEFNENFICKTANDRFMRMFNVSRLQLRGKSMFDFIEEGSLKSAALKDVLTRDSLTTTLPFKVNGQVTTFEVSISKTTSLDGRVAKFILLLIKEIDQMPVMAAV